MVSKLKEIMENDAEIPKKNKARPPIYTQDINKVKTYQDSLKLSKTFPRGPEWAELHNSLLRLTGKAPKVVMTDQGERGVESPVQPYIFQKKIEPSLRQKVLDLQTIPINTEKNIKDISTLEHPPIASRPIPQGNYMLGYQDENGEGVDRGFITAEQRADFIKYLKNRNLSSVKPYIGNITEYKRLPKKKND